MGNRADGITITGLDEVIDIVKNMEIDDYTETINEIEQNIEDIKNHLVDDNMVVKKGTDGITVKLFPQ